MRKGADHVRAMLLGFDVHGPVGPGRQPGAMTIYKRGLRTSN